ncbi:unnamed protein product [Alopecurus aequalis]
MATTACGVGAGALLPDDVLRDIFSRLPDPNDLLRCAHTCRHWHRLLGELAFLRQRASFIPGAFSQLATDPIGPKEPMKRNESLYPPQFEGLHTPQPDGLRFSDLALFFPRDGGLFDYANPLASRRGLLLLRIKPMPFDSRKLHLVVCHPLIGEQGTRLLPPPPLNVDPKSGGDDVIGYAIVTAADHSNLHHQQRHSAFHVFFTAVGSDKQLRAYSYSSAMGRWGTPIDCPQVFRLTMSGPRAGTVAEGAVHWLYTDDTSYYTLDVGTDSEQAVSLTKIPVQVRHYTHYWPPPPFPCTVRGKLAFVHAYYIGKLELWTKQENNDDHGVGGWLCSELMYEPGNNITMYAFLENKGAMLIQTGFGFFTLDLESKELDRMADLTWDTRKLCDEYMCGKRNRCGDCTYNKRVIYEMDWPSYLLHLYGHKEVVQHGEDDACRI